MIALTITLFIIVAILGVLPINSTGKLSQVFLLALSLVLVLLSGFRNGDQFPDYSAYLIMYDDIKTDEVIVEPSFLLIANIVHFVFNNVLFLFVIYALIGVSIKLTAIKQLTDLWLLSLVVYVSNFFILHEMIQIRAGVAAAFLLLCIKPIYDRNLKKFLLFSLLSMFFHISAIIVLPLWFIVKINKRILIYVLTAIIPIAFCIYFLNLTILNFIPIPYVQEKLDLYIYLQELEVADFLTGINVFNYVFLAKILIFYFLLYKHAVITANNKYGMILLTIYGIALFMYPALAMMPVMATRVSELLGVVEIILFPLVYYTFANKDFTKILIIVYSLGILLINIYKSGLIF